VYYLRENTLYIRGAKALSTAEFDAAALVGRGFGNRKCGEPASCVLGCFVGIHKNARLSLFGLS
jgi:hypothetical protein